MTAYNDSLQMVWLVFMSLRDKFAYMYTSEATVAELAAEALPVYLLCKYTTRI